MVLGELGLADKFQHPKPVELIKRCIQISTEPDDIILDSFGGSGTTAHAVLALNKEDGGNRKFILVECEDYADSHHGGARAPRHQRCSKARAMRI